ncbi:unnamed protein product [Rhizopus microsporus]
MKGVDFRPNTTENAIDNQKCIICDSKMKRKLWNVKVNFKFGDAKFIMDQRGERTHGACPPTHLTEHEKKGECTIELSETSCISIIAGRKAVAGKVDLFSSP